MAARPSSRRRPDDGLCSGGDQCRGLLDTVSPGGEPFGLASDGVAIWATDAANTAVTRLGPSDGAVLGTCTTGNAAEGIAFDGAALRVANSQAIGASRF